MSWCAMCASLKQYIPVLMAQQLVLLRLISKTNPSSPFWEMSISMIYKERMYAQQKKMANSTQI